jgi:hypothetical protein
MPKQPLEQYYSQKELHEMVERINAFSNDYSPWKFTRARIEHEDLFGEVIKPGEDYFKYQRGIADDVKLSILSMEKLCFALFESAVLLKPIADRILKQRQKRMFELMNKASILGNRRSKRRKE